MDTLQQLIVKHYGSEPKSITPVAGYANANYKIVFSDDNSYVLKAMKVEPGLLELLLTEGRILALLSDYREGYFQKPVPARDGKVVVEDHQFPDQLFRLLTWLDGQFMHEAIHTPELFKSMGDFLAGMDQVLMTQPFTAIAARRIDWDLSRLPVLKDRLEDIQDIPLRNKVHYFMLQFQEEVVPELEHLRHATIHNDFNDWNVLVKNNKVAGLIDFGDVVYAPLIQELAVCLTYACFDKEDPLEWAGYVLDSYHKVLPLEEKEIDCLYYLVAGRLCMSLLNSAHSRILEPANDYLDVSVNQAVSLLEKWLEINPVQARIRFRKACGFADEAIEPVTVSLEKRFNHSGTVLSVSYKEPIHMQRAAFQYMYDVHGNTFLDAYNNIPHVGHEHPRVVEAGQRQMARLNTNTRYLYDGLAEYSEKLIKKFPPSLNKVFFVNSGSAASDLAIRLAQTYTGHRNVMVLEHGYHGHTRLGIDISHYKFGSRGGAGQADYILKVPIPDTFRGPFKQNDGTAGIAYADQALDVLNESGISAAAFIAEPIVGCAGQVPLARGYLKQLYPEIRKQGGVCISDEVQTGFGRLGEVFWGFEQQEVVPDIVVLGKPMGNGHPMAAVVTTDEIARAFDNGMEFFSSFGGNPVSCAIGIAVLDVIEEEGLQNNAFLTGEYFLKELRTLQKKYPTIGDVRGHGLFLGIEFVKDRTSIEFNPVLANLVKNEMRKACILVSTDGPHENIIKMKPPLCFNKTNVDQVIDELNALLLKV